MKDSDFDKIFKQLQLSKTLGQTLCGLRFTQEQYDLYLAELKTKGHNGSRVIQKKNIDYINMFETLKKPVKNG